MKMTFRWYERESDPIRIQYVKQGHRMSGLYGGALGAACLNGIGEALCRMKGNK